MIGSIVGTCHGSRFSKRSSLPSAVSLADLLAFPRPSIVANVTRKRGGLEMLFSNQREHSLDISATNEDGKPSTIASLTHYLCQNTMKDSRKELFMLNGHMYVS
jgi:hypothetical protein